MLHLMANESALKCTFAFTLNTSVPEREQARTTYLEAIGGIEINGPIITVHNGYVLTDLRSNEMHCFANASGSRFWIDTRGKYVAPGTFKIL